jgi:hypothetical protein
LDGGGEALVVADGGGEALEEGACSAAVPTESTVFDGECGGEAFCGGWGGEEVLGGGEVCRAAASSEALVFSGGENFNGGRGCEAFRGGDSWCDVELPAEDLGGE